MWRWSRPCVITLVSTLNRCTHRRPTLLLESAILYWKLYRIKIHQTSHKTTVDSPHILITIQVLLVAHHRAHTDRLNQTEAWTLKHTEKPAREKQNILPKEDRNTAKEEEEFAKQKVVCEEAPEAEVCSLASGQVPKLGSITSFYMVTQKKT